MLRKVRNPFCIACVKGLFDWLAIVSYKSPGWGRQKCWRTEKCGWGEVGWKKKPAEENKLDNISGTAGSKQHLVQRNTGNKQTSSTHSNTGSSLPTHRKEFGHYVAKGDWFTFWPDACWWSNHYSSFLDSVQEHKYLRGLVCVSGTIPAWDSSLLL